MKITTKYLYELLPAYYRVIDEENGNPLKAFITLLAREGRIVEENITQLYENWFIETCDEWVVPYIGDLLGVKGIHEIKDASVYSRRAYIANTLSYRRRKGTAPVIEQIAFDITGWRSKVVEFFQLLSTTQNLNHIRLHNTVTPDLRLMNSIDLINTPFDKQSHTVDVRRIETGQGLYNIMNIGVYLWRLGSYPLQNTNARLVPSATGIPVAAYTFNALGIDSHLFNNPQTEENIVHLAKEINVPGLLRRRALHDELENAREAIVNGHSPSYTYFDLAYPPVFQIFINGNPTPIPSEEITICNLSSWRLPPISKDYKKYESDGTISIIPKNITAAVDPVLGRITFADPVSINDVCVNYSYGFSGDVGGGPYDRASSLTELGALNFDRHVGVSKEHTSTPNGESIYSTLWDAINDWHGQPDGTIGLITIMDNKTYEEDLIGAFKIQISTSKKLYIIAADWPIKYDASGNPVERLKGAFNPEDTRPHILGDIEIECIDPTGENGGGVLFNGLLIEGQVKVLNTGNLNNLNNLHIEHCTIISNEKETGLPPNKEPVLVMPQNGKINLTLKHSICVVGGSDSEDSIAINVESTGASVKIEECIIDDKTGIAFSVLDGQLAIQESTIYGKVNAKFLDASNCIFMNHLEIERRQVGCIRFSYVPDGAKTPRRYRCQPELEINTQIKDLEEVEGPLSNMEKLNIKNQILNWLFPVFNSIQYGHYAYSQLGNATPVQITTGGDNGSEMGVFNYLQQPQREANLKIVLKEYTPLGLEAGIIYIT